MTWWGALSVLGMFVTLFGLGTAAVSTGIQWKDLSSSTDYFLPPRLRKWLRRPQPVNVYVRTASGRGEGHLATVATRSLMPNGTVDERLAALEEVLEETVRNVQTADSALHQELIGIAGRVDSVQSQVDGLPRMFEEADRQKVVVNLRHAGWGLIWAAIGLLLQIPAGVAAAVS